MENRRLTSVSKTVAGLATLARQLRAVLALPAALASLACPRPRFGGGLPPLPRLRSRVYRFSVGWSARPAPCSAASISVFSFCPRSATLRGGGWRKGGWRAELPPLCPHHRPAHGRVAKCRRCLLNGQRPAQ